MDPISVILIAAVALIIGIAWEFFISRGGSMIKISNYVALIVLCIGLYTLPDHQVGKATPGRTIPDQTQATDAFDASTAQAQKYLAENSMPTMMPYQPAGSGYIPTGEPAEAAAKAVSDAVKKWGVTPGQIKAMSGPEYRQPDAKTVADKWPMKPPEIVPLSEWVEMFANSRKTLTFGSYRWVRVDGRLGLQSRLAASASISFLPETTPATTATPAEPKEEKP